MGEIVMSMAPRGVKASMEGRKTCTARLRPKGKIGDVFQLDGKWFGLTAVYIDELEAHADQFFKAEGYDSPSEFLADFCELSDVVYCPVLPIVVHWYWPVASEQLPVYARSEVVS
ncbi:hypothetical protein [Methanocella sp. MCL-LM]|uniref:hypothetical protein n=1 Tax=Methanocella sp. MCL-LM TaxID=3412035 RepID=UPI003C751928